MNIVKLYYISCIILTISLVQNSYAQVTIGASAAPIDGALLQLKENEGTGANSTRGMLLPRVKLTTLNDLSDLGAGLNKDQYVGLAVYSVAEDLCAVNYVYKGLYTWDGKKWQYVGKEKQLAPEIGTFTDTRDGTVYHYRDFGATAGTWMLDDMRALTYAQGSTIPVLSANTSAHDPASKYFCYPAPSGDGTDDQYFIAQPAIAILYSWAAAINVDPTNGGVPNPGATPQGEDAASPLLIGPQGICPNGWHIPSDKEWNDLEEAIATEPAKYSTNSGTVWNQIWRTYPDNQWRPTFSETDPGHSTSMKSPCQPISDTTHYSSGGKSFLATDGGFNIMLVGDGYDGAIHNHGEEVSFWSASAASSGAAWARKFIWRSTSVSRLTNDRKRLFSVRCKMD